jgi:retron-type reverse transcriptase
MMVARRVCDGVILRVIGKWLQAGVLEGTQLSYPEQGTPQGGVISPLLANIYLHEVLDQWLNRTSNHGSKEHRSWSGMPMTQCWALNGQEETRSECLRCWQSVLRNMR